MSTQKNRERGRASPHPVPLPESYCYCFAPRVRAFGSRPDSTHIIRWRCCENLTVRSLCPGLTIFLSIPGRFFVISRRRANTVRPYGTFNIVRMDICPPVHHTFSPFADVGAENFQPLQPEHPTNFPYIQYINIVRMGICPPAQHIFTERQPATTPSPCRRLCQQARPSRGTYLRRRCQDSSCRSRGGRC